MTNRFYGWIKNNKSLTIGLIGYSLGMGSIGNKIIYDHMRRIESPKSENVIRINSINEEVAVDGHVGELKNPKIHYSHKNIHEFIKKINFYTDLEAIKLKNENVKFGFTKMLYEAKKSFMGRFLIKKGFLDGWRGFMLSYLRAIYKLILWVKVWEKEQK